MRRLAEDLKATGVDVWLDEWEIRVGDSLRQRIEEGIQSSAWLAVILSEHSVGSQWVNRELNAAFARELEVQRVFILPIRIDNCEIPVFLKDKFYADFRFDYEAGLRSLLKAIVGHDVPTKNLLGLWWGRWNIREVSSYVGGYLFIHNVEDGGFRFRLSVFRGAHVGDISGFAQFSGSARAVFMQSFDNYECKLTFLIEFRQTAQITIQENEGCLGFHGFKATFDGTYLKEHEVFFEFGILDERDLTRLYQLQGEYYWKFREIFYQVSEYDNADDFEATIYVGGAPGLYTIVEAILMKGEQGQLWTAYIDDEVVRYFTTESEFTQRLPRTLEVWRERFPEKPVVFDSPITHTHEEE